MVNKTVREVRFSVWFEEDDFSRDFRSDYSSALEFPKYSREQIHQILDLYLDQIEEDIKNEEE